MRAIVLLAALAFGGSVSGQQASYTYINQPGGDPGLGDVVWLNARNSPKIGTTFQVQIPGSVCLPRPVPSGCSNFFLLTGTSNPDVDLGLLGPLFWGFLFSSGEVMIWAPSYSYGTAFVVSFPIPSDPSLIGMSFYQQTVRSIGGYGMPTFIAASRGGHGVIGM